MTALTDADLDAIQARLEASTPGPWYFRSGVHTNDLKTSDAGGLHTRTTYPIRTPDGREVQNDNVLFPVTKIDGDPYWLERFRRRAEEGRGPISLALDVFVRPADAALIEHAQDDLRLLLAEVRRLRKGG